MRQEMLHFCKTLRIDVLQHLLKVNIPLVFIEIPLTTLNFIIKVLVLLLHNTSLTSSFLLNTHSIMKYHFSNITW